MLHILRFNRNTRDSPTAFKFTNDPSVPMKFVQTYNPNLPTKFVIHGWQNSISSPVCQQVKDAYLKREDMNVFGKILVSLSVMI